MNVKWKLFINSTPNIFPFQERLNISKCFLLRLDGCWSYSWIDYYCRESVKLNMEYFRIIGDIFSRSSWVQGLEGGTGCELMGGEGGKWNQQGWPWTRRLPRAHAGYARIRRKIGMEESSNHWERGRKDTKRERELGIDRKGDESLPCQFSQG